jgi:phytoene/squalene synthetase
MNEEKLAQFARLYEANLRRAVLEYPTEYVYAVEAVPQVAERMLRAIRAGGYNKDSRAIKATCKELGIKHTYKAIDEYLGRC